MDPLEGIEDQPLGAVEEPEELKAILESENVSEEAKAFTKKLFYRQAAFEETVPNLEEAREIATMFPGGMEDMRSALEASDQYSQITGALFSQEGPQEFAEMLHKQSPQQYFALHGHFLDHGIRALYAAADQAGDEVKSNAIKVVYDAFKKSGMANGGAGTTPPPVGVDPDLNGRDSPDQRLEQRYRDLNAKERDLFISEANTISAEGTLAAIEAKVDALIGDTPIAQGAKAGLVKEIYRQVDKTCFSNPTFRNDINRRIETGKLTREEARTVGELVLKRQAMLIPRLAPKLAREWLGTAVSAHNQHVGGRKQQAARSVDLGSAGGGPSDPSAGIHPSQIDYSKTSDKDILEGNVTLKGA